MSKANFLLIFILLKDENDYLIAELNEDWQDSGLVGHSAVFQRMLDQIQLVSETDSTVLILGVDDRPPVPQTEKEETEKTPEWQ